MTPKMVIVDVLLRRFGGKMIFEQRLEIQQKSRYIFDVCFWRSTICRSKIKTGEIASQNLQVTQKCIRWLFKSGTSGTKYCGGTVLAILGWRAGVASVASTGPLYTGHPAHNAQFGLRPHTAHISLQHPASLHHPYTGTQVRQN